MARQRVAVEPVLDDRGAGGGGPTPTPASTCPECGAHPVVLDGMCGPCWVQDRDAPVRRRHQEPAAAARG